MSGGLEGPSPRGPRGRSESGRLTPRRRRLARATAAIALGLLLAAGLAELGLRLAGVTSEPRHHFRPGLYVPDDELGWALAPDYRGVHLELTREVPTTTNAQGLRGPAWDDARARAALRVLALGDSCTFGRGVEDGETWPARLEARLRARGLDAAVVNAGVPGYGTTQELALFRRLAPRLLRPTHVVLCWLPNDAHGAPPLQVLEGQLVKDAADLAGWRARAERRGASASALYRFLRVRWKLLEAGLGLRRDAAPGPITDAQLATTQAPLAALLDEARALGATPVVVLLPREEELLDEGFDTTHHARMAAFLRARGVDVLDLSAAWRGRRGLYLPRDPIHLAPAGYDALARAVAEVTRGPDERAR